MNTKYMRIIHMDLVKKSVVIQPLNNQEKPEWMRSSANMRVGM